MNLCMYVCMYVSISEQAMYYVYKITLYIHTLCGIGASGVSPGLRAAQPVYRDDPAGYRTAHLICTFINVLISTTR